MKLALGTGNPGWSRTRPEWNATYVAKKAGTKHLVVANKRERKNIAMLVYNRDEDVLE